MILHPVVAFEQDEIGQPGHHRLAVLRPQEILQVVVAQGGEFDVDFPHDPHPHLGHPMDRDGGEIVRNRIEVLPHVALAERALAGEILHQPLHPGGDAAVGLPLHDFIGAALVGHVHD